MSREREREHPWELVIIKPSVPIKPMLEKEGYPFKSKNHSRMVYQYQHSGMSLKTTRRYYEANRTWTSGNCPQILKYQFEQELPFRVSDKCCKKLKVNPLHEWQKQNKRPYGFVGLMREEGGRRESAKCLVFKDGKLKNFQPLVAITKKWEEWFIKEYNIDISDIYKPPYNFERTGCKGCPFGLGVQQELDTLEQYFPNERKQCEAIWKPVYDEYRRLGYRLRKDDQIEGQQTLDMVEEGAVG